MPPAEGRPAEGPPAELPRDLRVLHVVQKYSSGVGAAIAQYTQSLPTVEHHLLSGTAVDAEGDLADHGRFAAVHRMEGGHLARIRRVREVVHEVRPEVVHAHSSHGGVYARLAVPRTAYHLVYTPHCYAFERRDVSEPVRAAFWLAEALLALNTSVFAACSEREARLSAWPTRRAPRLVVPNIAPPCSGRSTGGRTGAPVVAGGGRIGPQKDPEFFVACIRRLRQVHPDLRAVWLGDGEAARRAGLEAADVRVTGWLPRGAAMEVLGEADLYLHSARWEGFPLMVAEAAALGVPTLVRRLPCFEGVPEELTLSGEDVRAASACLVDGGAVRANLDAWSELLAGNTPAGQQAALAAAYARALLSRRPPHGSRRAASSRG